MAIIPVRFIKGNLTGLCNRSYIIQHGSKNLQEVGRLLRQSHLFLFSQINPPCPNAVLEAVASGLLVISFDSGSLSELLPFQPDLLCHSNDAIGTLHLPGDFDHLDLTEKIELAVANLEHYQANAQAHSKVYSFDKCGGAYIKLLGKFI